MIQGVMFDLRDEDFRTCAGMNTALDEHIERCQAEYDAFVPVAIILHDMQAKWLKLEMYEREHIPAQTLRTMFLGSWRNIPIITVDDWEKLPCPNCGEVHDTPDAWYADE